MSRRLRFNESGRAELVVHLALGAATVAAAFICLCATFGFVSGTDRPGAWLSTRPAPENCAIPKDAPRNSLTNVADPEFQPVNSVPTPKSDPDVGQPPADRATALPTG